MAESRPDCIVADVMFPWVGRSAAKLGVRGVVFKGTSFFSVCAAECVAVGRPYKGVSTDSEEFVIAGLPGEIRMTRVQVGGFVMEKEEAESVGFFKALREADDGGSHGVVVNSFYQLEQDYAHYYRYVMFPSFNNTNY